MPMGAVREKKIAIMTVARNLKFACSEKEKPEDVSFFVVVKHNMSLFLSSLCSFILFIE
jgi:hypothetical protein